MTGEIDFFRKRFIGGFDRKDVVDYVAKLASERNALAEARDKAVQETKELAGLVEALRREVEDTRRYAESFRVDALEHAKIVLLELETDFESLSIDVRASVAGACDQLRAAIGTIEGVNIMLEGTGEKIAGLKSLLDDKRADEPFTEEII